MSAKVYGLDSSLIHDASPKDGFVVDVVRFSDYAVLEKKCQSLVAENAVMKEIINSVTDLDNEPQYHSEGMGCGLEDKGITDRYDAMQYGWDCAMSRIYGEVIPCAEELSFPATDAALNEIKAQGVDEWIASRNGQWNGTTKEAELFAASLRSEQNV